MTGKVRSTFHNFIFFSLQSRAELKTQFFAFNSPLINLFSFVLLFAYKLKLVIKFLVLILVLFTKEAPRVMSFTRV